MRQFESGAFDPDTVILMRRAVDQTWDCLPHFQQALTSKEAIAEAICHLAADGERDLVRLCTYALTIVPVLLKPAPNPIPSHLRELR